MNNNVPIYTSLFRERNSLLQYVIAIKMVLLRESKLILNAIRKAVMIFHSDAVAGAMSCEYDFIYKFFNKILI